MTRQIWALLGCMLILLCVSDVWGQYRRSYGRRDDVRRHGSSRDRGSSDRGEKKKAYRFKTAHERLPDGIPEWFVEKDADKDGQVKMAEFATKWTDRLVAEFLQFDSNGDGVVTPKECLAVRNAGIVDAGSGVAVTRSASPTSDGTSSTTPPGRPQTNPPPASPSSQGSSAGTAPSQTTAQTETEKPDTEGPKPEAEDEKPEPEGKTPAPDSEPPSAPQTVEIPESYMNYAISYIRMHDRDGNNMLTADEWEKMRKSPQSADANSDGRVSAQEYALWTMKR